MAHVEPTFRLTAVTPAVACVLRPLLSGPSIADLPAAQHHDILHGKALAARVLSGEPA